MTSDCSEVATGEDGETRLCTCTEYGRTKAVGLRVFFPSPCPSLLVGLGCLLVTCSRISLVICHHSV